MFGKVCLNQASLRAAYTQKVVDIEPIWIAASVVVVPQHADRAAHTQRRFVDIDHILRAATVVAVPQQGLA